MQEITESISTELDAQAPANNRRAFLGRVAAVGLALASMKLMPEAKAAKMPKQPEADTGHDYPMAKPTARTAKQFYAGVMGPAVLSLMTSEIAVDKATDPKAKEFANFELREAIGVTKVLKEMGTPVPPMPAAARAILKQIQTLPAGEAFDKAYMKAQLANHEFLRDLANTYLSNSEGKTSMTEMHGRHLAMLTLATFKEHVVHCKNFMRM